MSTAIFGLVVFTQKISRAQENFNENIEVSSTLNTFLQFVLGGCSIQFIFRPKMSKHEQIVSLLQKKTTPKTSYKSYMLKTFDVGLQSYSNKTNSWQFRQHSFCHAHLYVLNNGKDLLEMVEVQFPEFESRRDNPGYIILWNVGFTRHAYLRNIQKGNFNQMFMDYRLLIDRDRETKIFDVKLVCLVCSRMNPVESVKAIAGKISREKIHRIWIHSHSDHFGIGSFICTGCVIISFPKVLHARFNMTHDTGKPYIKVGQINLKGLSKTNIQHYLKSTQFIWHATFLIRDYYKMFTVARKALLQATGWKSFLEPMLDNVWYTILATMTTVNFILSRTSETKGNISLALLCIFGPLTDHWLIPCSVRTWKYVLQLWGILCFSLTLLYGGDLASCLSVLSPPQYPKDIDDFGIMGIRNVDALSLGGWSGGYSPLAEVLYFKKRESRNAANFMRLAHKIERKTCDLREITLSHKNKRAPYRCGLKIMTRRINVPVTFVDIQWLSVSAKTAFEASDLYWVSRTTV